MTPRQTSLKPHPKSPTYTPLDRPPPKLLTHSFHESPENPRIRTNPSSQPPTPNDTRLIKTKNNSSALLRAPCLQTGHRTSLSPHHNLRPLPRPALLPLPIPLHLDLSTARPEPTHLQHRYTSASPLLSTSFFSISCHESTYRSFLCEFKNRLLETLSDPRLCWWRRRRRSLRREDPCLAVLENPRRVCIVVSRLRSGRLGIWKGGGEG